MKDILRFLLFLFLFVLVNSIIFWFCVPDVGAAQKSKIERKVIFCIPSSSVEIKYATPIGKIELDKKRFEEIVKLLKQGKAAKLPILSASNFEEIKPKGLTKQEENLLKGKIVRKKNK